MNTMCPRTTEVGEAARLDQWTDALIQHVNCCDNCAETAFVTGIVSVKHDAATQATLADPTLIWCKGLAGAKLNAMERVTRPTAVVEIVVLVAGILLAAFGAAWSLAVMSSIDSRAVENGLPVLLSGMAMGLAAGVALRLSQARSDGLRNTSAGSR